VHTASLFSRSWRATGRLLRRKWLLVPLVALLGLAGGVTLVRPGAQSGQEGGRINAGGGQLPGGQAPFQLPLSPTASAVGERSEANPSGFGPAAATPEAEEIRQGVINTLREQFAACNEENMDRLLACFSVENTFQPRDISRIDASWNVNDTYCRLDCVEILSDSDAPGAKFEPPYATVQVTQTVIELPVGDERNPVFRRRCRQDDSDLLMLAERLGYRNRRISTTSIELLFKEEEGTWKFVTAVTEPVEAGGDSDERRGLGVGVPFQQKSKQSRSAFN
jgi:hypothetical protein